MVVSDDVWVTKRAEDVEFRGQLLSFLLRHLDVVYFLTAEDLFHVVLALQCCQINMSTHKTIRLAFDLSNDAEGAGSCSMSASRYSIMQRRILTNLLQDLILVRLCKSNTCHDD